MKSTASIKGHPIHPILICFPIAFLTATWVFDLLQFLDPEGDFANTARYLNIAGIVAGLLAAVPGVIDFTTTIPKNSSAKKRGAKHGILNTTVIALFIAAWFMRDGDHQLSLIITLETVGVILLFISGWLGGTLIYKNQIGVVNRYAASGKWAEEKTDEINGRAAVTGLEQLKINQMKLVHVGDRRIVVANSENGYVAFDDRCPHKGGSLAGGAMMCGTVQCPWHGSQFSVTNGAVTAGPSEQGISVYKIMQDNGKHYILLT